MTSERRVIWLTSFSHFITHGYMTLLPAVLVVIASEHSMSFLDIGLVANVGYFLYGLGAFPAGWLADRFGSKRMLSIGVFGMAAASILVGLSPGAWGFAVAYTLLGIFASIHHPAGLSLIARRIEVRGKALGVHGVLGNVGLFLTPLAAGLCVLLFHTWRAAYLFYGVIGLGFGLVVYLVRIENEPDLVLSRLFRRRSGEAPEPARSSGPAAREESSRPEVVIPVALLCLYLGSILSGFIFRGSLTFFPALFQREVHFISINEEPVVIAAYVTTAVLSLGLIGSWLGGWLNDKVKHPEWVPVGIFLIVAPALYYISRLVDAGLLVTACVFSLVYYAWQPAQNYLIARYTRKASHGMGFGINFFLIFGMGSVATFIGGYMADNYGVDRFYWLMSLVAAAALAAGLTVIFSRRYRIRLRWRLTRDDEW